MSMNQITQVNLPPAKQADFSGKKIVELGAFASNEPAAVRELRKVVEMAMKFKTPKGVYVVTVN